MAAGRLDPAALRSAACLICATERAHLRATGCCATAICAGCIDTTVRTKTEAASQLVVKYLDKAHQCPRCGHGPVEHFACDDLTAHDVGHNKYEKYSFHAANIREWSPWTGELPLEPAVELQCAHHVLGGRHLLRVRVRARVRVGVRVGDVLGGGHLVRDRARARVRVGVGVRDWG